jgi:hypothetical protein
MEEAMFMKLTTTTKVSNTLKNKSFGEGAKKKGFIWPHALDFVWNCAILCQSDGSYSAGEAALVDMM